MPEGAQRAQAGRQVVDRRSTAPRHATRRCSPRTSSRKALARSRLRQGLGRGRGLRPRLRPPPPRRHPCPRCGSPTSSARRCAPRSRRTSRCRSCRPCSASTRGCSSCTSGRSRGRCGGPRLGDYPGTFNIAGDGVLTLSQAIRRTGHPFVPLPSARRTVDRPGAAPARRRRLLRRADAVPHLRPGRRHLADEGDPRPHPALHRRRRRSRTSSAVRGCTVRCRATTSMPWRQRLVDVLARGARGG